MGAERDSFSLVQTDRQQGRLFSICHLRLEGLVCEKRGQVSDWLEREKTKREGGEEEICRRRRRKSEPEGVTPSSRLAPASASVLVSFSRPRAAIKGLHGSRCCKRGQGEVSKPPEREWTERARARERGRRASKKKEKRARQVSSSFDSSLAAQKEQKGSAPLCSPGSIKTAFSRPLEVSWRSFSHLEGNWRGFIREANHP